MRGHTHMILLALDLLSQLEQRGEVLLAEDTVELRPRPTLEIPRQAFAPEHTRESRGGYAVVPESYHRRRK